MTRKKKLILNAGTGMLKQIIVVICGFILPRYIILYYGSEVNGLISSITHFLSFISLLEMGIGPVVQANLYSPLAKRDWEHVSKVVISTERFFRRIASIFLMYVGVLVFVYPTIIAENFDFFFTVSLLVIIAISTAAQYFFGATYQLLLNADQKVYIQTSLQIVTIIINTVFSIVLMKLGAPIHIVKLLTTAIFVLRPIGQAFYVRKHYELNKRIKLQEEPIKQKWNGFAQHLAAVVCSNVDVVLLSCFSTLANVSIYSVYYNVTHGVTTMVMTAATGLESFFGNIIANGEKEVLLKAFERVELLIHLAVSVIFTIAAITIVPFVSVYTLDIADVNYISPVFATILMVAYALQCLRVPYFRIIKAAGHFKETQNGAFIAAILNIVISLLLVKKYALLGVGVGTLVAMTYNTLYFVWYLKDNILKRSIWNFVKYLFTDVLVIILSIMLSRNITMENISYLAWLCMSVKVGILTVGIAAVVNVICHHKFIVNVFKRG